MKKIKLNVLSLFDGIGCAKLALKKSKNIEINRYFYSEIDKNCFPVKWTILGIGFHFCR